MAQTLATIYLKWPLLVLLVANQRTLIDFSLRPVDELGHPDGMCIDEEDKLWIACFDAGKVIRFDPATGRPVVTARTHRRTQACMHARTHARTHTHTHTQTQKKKCKTLQVAARHHDKYRRNCNSTVMGHNCCRVDA